MDIGLMRDELVDELNDRYPKCRDWRRRVMAMTDRQVMGIYFSIRERPKPERKDTPVYEQLSFL